MIKSFRHTGLKRFVTTGNKSGIPSTQAQRQGDILFRLQIAVQPQDLDFSGSGLHPLKGSLQGFWAVKVSGNWRVIFRFSQDHALEVDFANYH